MRSQFQIGRVRYQTNRLQLFLLNICNEANPGLGKPLPLCLFFWFVFVLHACSLSALQSCSFTSDGSVLNRSSSTTKPLLFNRRHSPSSTGRHSRRFPLSSSWVRPVSSPKRDGSVCKQLLPRLRVRSFLHWNSSGGKVSI